jgi:hypothetical protein
LSCKDNSLNGYVQPYKDRIAKCLQRSQIQNIGYFCDKAGRSGECFSSVPEWQFHGHERQFNECDLPFFNRELKFNRQDLP